jgi:diguanylate cyclase (GGDEF)-like protein/PAS domain S-box-containing protein
MLLDQVNDAVVCHTLDGRIIYVNEAACRERGYTREEFLTLNVRDLIAPDTRMRYGDVHEDLMRDGTVVFESDDVKADGTRMVVEVKARLVEIDGEPVVVSIARDISERKQAQEAVERIAFTDPLTGLPNRRALMDRLEVVLAEAAATGELVMVAFLDLDYFKDVNDRFGHAVGDAVLELAAMRLSANVRAEDMVGRLGGDEFVVVASGLDDRKDVDRIAAKLVAVFGEPFDVDGTQVSSAVSVGVALNEPREISVIDVLANADLAMYTAKDRRRCRYAMYVPAMRAPAPLGSAESGAEQPVS